MIQRIVLNIDFAEQGKALDIQDDITNKLKTELPYSAEKIFDELEINKDTQVVIDKLEINIGTLAAENAPQNFMRKLNDQLRYLLSGIAEKRSQEGVSVNNTETSELDAYFYFLDNGFFPWWYKIEENLNQLSGKIQSISSTQLFRYFFSSKNTLQLIQRHYHALVSDKRKTLVFKLSEYFQEHKTEIVNQLEDKATASQLLKTASKLGSSSDEISEEKIRVASEILTNRSTNTKEALQNLLQVLNGSYQQNEFTEQERENLKHYFELIQRKQRNYTESTNIKLEQFPTELLILMVLAYNIEQVFPQFSLRLVAKLKQQHRLFSDHEVYHFLLEYINSNHELSISSFIQKQIKKETEKQDLYSEPQKVISFWNKLLMQLGFKKTSSIQAETRSKKSFWKKMLDVFSSKTSEAEVSEKPLIGEDLIQKISNISTDTSTIDFSQFVALLEEFLTKGVWPVSKKFF